MSRAVFVTYSYVRRVPCPYRCPGPCQHGQDSVYFVCFVVQVGSAGEEETGHPEQTADGLSLSEQLRDAIADTAADDAVNLIFGTWSDPDGWRYLEVVDALNEVPDAVHGQIADAVAGFTEPELPVWVSVFDGDVAATLVLKPIAEPVGKLVRAAEIAGLVFALLTGLHPLAVACAKHLGASLMKSELAEALGREWKTLTGPQSIEATSEPGVVEAAGSPKARSEPKSMLESRSAQDQARRCLLGADTPTEVAGDETLALLELADSREWDRAAEPTRLVKWDPDIGPIGGLGAIG